MDPALMEVEGINLSTFELDIILHPSTSEAASSIVPNSAAFRFTDEGHNLNPPHKRVSESDPSEERQDRVTQISQKVRTVAGPSRREFDKVRLRLFFVFDPFQLII